MEECTWPRSYLENAAFNPSMMAMQAAIVAALSEGSLLDTVVAASLVQRQPDLSETRTGVPKTLVASASTFCHYAASKDLLELVAPNAAELDVISF